VVPSLETLLFVLHGLLGAFLSQIMWAKSYKDLYSFKAISTYIIGGIAGYIYYYLHSDYNLPNSLLTIVVGYFAKDFIHAILERLKSAIFGTSMKSKEI